MYKTIIALIAYTLSCEIRSVVDIIILQNVPRRVYVFTLTVILEYVVMTALFEYFDLCLKIKQ